MYLYSSNKGQASFELFIVMGFMFLVFTVFAAAIMQKMVEITTVNDRQLLVDLATRVEEELTLASSVENGFSREFTLPEYLGKREYEMKYETDSADPKKYNHLAFRYTEVLDEKESEYIITLPLNVEITGDTSTNKLTPGKICVTKENDKAKVKAGSC
jgi:hypothetical protein